MTTFVLIKITRIAVCTKFASHTLLRFRPSLFKCRFSCLKLKIQVTKHCTYRRIDLSLLSPISKTLTLFHYPALKLFRSCRAQLSEDLGLWPADLKGPFKCRRRKFICLKFPDSTSQTDNFEPKDGYWTVPVGLRCSAQVFALVGL